MPPQNEARTAAHLSVENTATKMLFRKNGATVKTASLFSGSESKSAKINKQPTCQNKKQADTPSARIPT
jgi:hypothetical protein